MYSFDVDETWVPLEFSPTAQSVGAQILTHDPLEPTILVTSEEELQRRLQFALSDPHFSPRFLAMNATLLPHLWRNQSHQPPAQIGDLGDGGRWDVELAAKTQELLEEVETKVAPVATAGFGPLTMLADQVPHFFFPVVWDLVPMVSCWVIQAVIGDCPRTEGVETAASSWRWREACSVWASKCGIHPWTIAGTLEKATANLANCFAGVHYMSTAGFCGHSSCHWFILAAHWSTSAIVTLDWLARKRREGKRSSLEFFLWGYLEKADWQASTFWLQWTCLYVPWD